ncbi:hypothetical protein IJS18_03230 [Candidatus Saccharibacteria bacterium]|nr:hypothetical protein [Candidatus Saccharibacteria bacterium]
MEGYYKPNYKPMSLKKLAVLSLFVAGIIVIVSIILSSLMNHFQSMEHVSFEKYPETMPTELREGLGVQLKNLLEINGIASEDDIVKAVIREGAYFEKTEDDVTTADFIVDIDDYQQSYLVTMSWSDTKEISDAIIIHCPTRAQSKYPESFCKSMYDTTTIVENIENNPLYKKLPIEVDDFDFGARQAIHYEIRGEFNDENDLVLTVVDYTGGQFEPAKAKIKELGYNPDDYEIKYFDDSGGF